MKDEEVVAYLDVLGRVLRIEFDGEIGDEEEGTHGLYALTGEVERQSSRPDMIVMGYGAFCFAGQTQGFFADPFSNVIRNPFFANKDEFLYYSPEINIKKDTPPFFIWQTNSDDPRNSFTMGSALTAMGIPFEMHLFPEGVHGLALADGNNDLDMDVPSVAQWVCLCVNWLNNLNL